MKTHLCVPEGQKFVPYKERDQYPRKLLDGSTPVTLGRGIDLLVLGWYVPLEAMDLIVGREDNVVYCLFQ